MKIDACLSHKTDDWKTPTDLYNKFITNGWLDTFKYKSNYDELTKEYENKKLFINPPFSKMNKITDWIIKQIKNNNYVALLIPPRTDTKYFHKLLDYKPTIYFIKGRLHYNDSKSTPFPTILLVFNPKLNTYPTYRKITIEELKEKI